MLAFQASTVACLVGIPPATVGNSGSCKCSGIGCAMSVSTSLRRTWRARLHGPQNPQAGAKQSCAKRLSTPQPPRSHFETGRLRLHSFPERRAWPSMQFATSISRSSHVVAIFHDSNGGATSSGSLRSCATSSGERSSWWKISGAFGLGPRPRSRDALHLVMSKAIQEGTSPPRSTWAWRSSPRYCVPAAKFAALRAAATPSIM